ncbi:hypothetical protein MBLNU459_g4954t2 [Dothideomycetes sp. NU459]
MDIDPSLSSLPPPADPKLPNNPAEESIRSSSSENIPFSELQNPSDALDILAQIASNDGGSNRQTWQSQASGTSTRPNMSSSLSYNNSNSWLHEGMDYHLVRSGRLSSAKIVQLLERYHRLYHPYFAIVPPSTLDPRNLPVTAQQEPHLLTAILVIASKDLLEESQVFIVCSEYMQSLVSALAAGGPGGVEAVEALLLLAEWTPYTSRSQAGNVGRGEEDREAWMHVGTALRIAYYLGLDKYSFPVIDDGKDPQWRRKRLVWTSCYISDRQISIRIGRAFWSRGPGPGLQIRKEDFPYKLQNPGDDDYASIFQATLELTLLFSNVHDVLYSSPGNSLRSHLTGGFYIKIVDDFRSAYYGWNSVYGTMTCSPNLKAMLLMSYDYLRLYTNAFAFHATIRRALPEGQNGKPLFSRVFYNNVGAVGDARFIYEGLDAAKSLLTTMNNFVDAERSLRYMPLRFYLFTVYAGVFLYHARTVGVMSPEEETSVRRMIQQTVTVLQKSGVGDQHPGNRYSQLLKLLWEKVDRKSKKETRNPATLENPYRPGSTSAATPASTSNHSAGALESPAVAEQMGDFSWTDLDAIGNFALNGNDGISADAEWWTGFLPNDSGPFGSLNGIGSTESWGLSM